MFILGHVLEIVAYEEIVTEQALEASGKVLGGPWGGPGGLQGALGTLVALRDVWQLLSVGSGCRHSDFTGEQASSQAQAAQPATLPHTGEHLYGDPVAQSVSDFIPRTLSRLSYAGMVG